jgi:hypothetical protein
MYPTGEYYVFVRPVSEKSWEAERAKENYRLSVSERKNVGASEKESHDIFCYFLVCHKQFPKAVSIVSETALLPQSAFCICTCLLIIICFANDVVLETRVSARDSSRRVFQKSRLVSVSKSQSLGSARLREASLEISTKNFKLRARVGRRAFQAVCQLLFSNGLNLYPRKKPRRKHHLLDWFTV